MAAAGGLSFCLDECLGHPLAEMLRRARAPGAPHIFGQRELGVSGIPDTDLFSVLHEKGVQVLVTRDSRILSASIRRNAWQDSGLTLFVLHRKWGDLPLFSLTRALFIWWPEIVVHATTGLLGAAWLVPVDTGKIQRMFAEGSSKAAPARDNPPPA